MLKLVHRILKLKTLSEHTCYVSKIVEYSNVYIVDIEAVTTRKQRLFDTYKLCINKTTFNLHLSDNNGFNHHLIPGDVGKVVYLSNKPTNKYIKKYFKLLPSKYINCFNDWNLMIELMKNCNLRHTDYLSMIYRDEKELILICIANKLTKKG